METIAITEWNGLVSPLYDAACSLRVVRSNNEITTIDVSDCTPASKADICSREGVTVLICGAISIAANINLEAKGIKIIPWVSGPVDTIVDAYRMEGAVSERFSMPGCRRLEVGPGKRRGGCCRNKINKNVCNGARSKGGNV